MNKVLITIFVFFFCTYVQLDLSPCPMIQFDDESKFKESEKPCFCENKGECLPKTTCVYMKNKAGDPKTFVCRSIQNKKDKVRPCSEKKLDVSGRPVDPFCNCDSDKKVCPKNQFCLLYKNGTNFCVGDFKVHPSLLGKELNFPNCDKSNGGKNCNCKGFGLCPNKTSCDLSNGERKCNGDEPLPSCLSVPTDDLNRPATLCDCGSSFGVCPSNYFCETDEETFSFTCSIDYNFKAWINEKIIEIN